MIQPDNAEVRKEAGRILASGGLIAFRTDTFYGLGANPLDASAVRRIRELKGREESKPILILISDTSELDRFIDERDGIFGDVARKYWPAPLTLVGTARSELP